MDALGAKDKNLLELAQKLDLLTKRIDSLFTQSDELTRKQIALESLHERLAQVDDLAKKTTWQLDALRQSRADLEVVRKEVQDFYTKERMKSFGWIASQQGCVGDTQDQKSQGAVCMFNRQDGASNEGLAIVVAQDEKSKQTDIFYARIDLTSEASPSP